MQSIGNKLQRHLEQYIYLCRGWKGKLLIFYVAEPYYFSFCIFKKKVTHVFQLLYCYEIQEPYNTGANKTI